MLVSEAQSLRSASRAELASTDQRRRRSGDDRLGMFDGHPHREQDAFGGNQLSTLRDHIFQIAHIHENTALDQKRGVARAVQADARHVGRRLNAQALRERASRGAVSSPRRDRRTTGAVRGHDETIEDGQSRNLQAARPGIADQDGGSLAHCAGLRLPPPKTPRSPK